jgi:hypothetical protein
MRKPLKIGFDLDGVLLYNPARIARPLISIMKRKHIAIKRQELEFYVPKPGLQQFLWKLFHKSSLFLSPGFKQIEQLKNQDLIEPYLITGRFNHLREDFERWQKRMCASQVFNQCFMNGKDEQPHLFKKRLINKLKLDVFIEDNWDIVQYLHQQCPHTKVIWVSNIFDNRIDYPDKVFSFKASMRLIEQWL